MPLDTHTGTPVPPLDESDLPALFARATGRRLDQWTLDNLHTRSVRRRVLAALDGVDGPDAEAARRLLDDDTATYAAECAARLPTPQPSTREERGGATPEPSTRAATPEERAARRKASAGQRTPAHIVSAITLIADYCAEHGYPAVTICDRAPGATFHADDPNEVRRDLLHSARREYAMRRRALAHALRYRREARVASVLRSESAWLQRIALSARAWAALWKQAAKGNRKLRRDRDADLAHEYSERVRFEARCDVLEAEHSGIAWLLGLSDDATGLDVAMSAHVNALQARITEALRHLDAGDLGAARRALRGEG